MGHGDGGSVGMVQQQSRAKACNLLIIWDHTVFVAMPDTPLNLHLHGIIDCLLPRLLGLGLLCAYGLVPAVDFKMEHLRLVLFQLGLVLEHFHLLLCPIQLELVTGSLGRITLAHCVSVVEKCVLCCVLAWGRRCA